jgi:hypothetical protein
VTSDDKPKTEKELKIAAAMATRPVGKKLAAKAEAKAAGKDTVKKAMAEKAEIKKAKAEEVDAATANVSDDLVRTPVEPTAQDIVGAAGSAAAGSEIVEDSAAALEAHAEAKAAEPIIEEKVETPAIEAKASEDADKK